MKRKTVLKKSYQQGDLLMRRLAEMPEGEQKVVGRKRLVLAHGENGHSHVIDDEEAELIQIGERILLKLTKAQTVCHEEHNAPTSLIPEPVYLAPGIWEIGRVKEFDWFSKMERQVMD